MPEIASPISQDLANNPGNIAFTVTTHAAAGPPPAIPLPWFYRLPCWSRWFIILCDTANLAPISPASRSHLWRVRSGHRRSRREFPRDPVFSDTVVLDQVYTAYPAHHLRTILRSLR